jgi:hypothetical protein
MCKPYRPISPNALSIGPPVRQYLRHLQEFSFCDGALLVKIYLSADPAHGYLMPFLYVYVGISLLHG